MPYSSGGGGHTPPPTEVNFLMVEITNPKPYIFMTRVNRQIKFPKSWGPGSSPSPTGSFFLRITHISETILSILTKLCPNVLWVILFQSYVRYVWGPIHHTYMTCLFFSFLLIYKTRPNDFDLQLGCCISDAFSIFGGWNQSTRRKPLACRRLLTNFIT